MGNDLKSRLKQAVRIRRDPAHARAVILDAARALLAEKGPDAIGLKDVARRAGVSHALVSHYFGTFDRLVEAALKAQADAVERDLVARIAQTGNNEGPEAWVDAFFGALADPLYGRLLIWALMSGRVQERDFFAHADRGLKRVADAIEARAAAEGVELSSTREELEFSLLLTVCTAFGYLISGPILWESLGHAHSPDRDRWFRNHLAQRLVAGKPAGWPSGKRRK